MPPASESNDGKQREAHGPVDHSRDGVFLFNFFVADRTEQNIAVWHHTAGWFQQERVSITRQSWLPMPAQRPPVHHHQSLPLESAARLLPALIFKRSFRNYVLSHFDANHTAPMPVHYRLA